MVSGRAPTAAGLRAIADLTLQCAECKRIEEDGGKVERFSIVG